MQEVRRDSKGIQECKVMKNKKPQVLVIGHGSSFLAMPLLLKSRELPDKEGDL